MRYLCLVYFESKRFNDMSAQELAKFQEDCRVYDQGLAQSGHLVRAEALESVETAATVRVRQGTMLTTDGPFAETKEQLCGFVLIQAESLDEALKLSSQSPFASRGSIEVRPVMERN